MMPPETSYDECPYASFAYPLTHIAHLHTIGRLFGMAPADFKTARVLEIGCASGGNLLPMADEFPDATFVGIDLSAVQTAAAREMADRLGLRNVRIECASVENFDPGDGGFDYIICHGVYSWVPPTGREAILRVCGRGLAAAGIALVSYNTLPGWNAVRSLREMMLYHCARFRDPAQRAAQARALLNFLKESKAGEKSAFTELLDQEIALLKHQPDSYLLHDHLEATNQPFYFHEFMAAAAAHWLDYLAEALPGKMFLGNYPPKVAEALKAANDAVRLEQYLDFINNRRFRSTLLCRRGTRLQRNLDPETILSFHLTGCLTAPKDFGASNEGEFVFRAPGGTTFSTKEPAATAVAAALVANPIRPVPAEEIVGRAAARGVDAEAARRALVANGLRLFFAGGLMLHSDSGRMVAAAGDQPCALPIARLQAVAGPRVTSGRHEMVDLDPPSRMLLRYLDGSCDRAALADRLLTHFRNNELSAQQEGKPVTDPELLERIAKGAVEPILTGLAAKGLLIA